MKFRYSCFYLFALLALPVSGLAQMGSTSAPVFKPLPPGDMPLAKKALERAVGADRATRFVLAETNCPFDTCTEVVERTVVFEERLELLNPAMRQVGRVLCYGKKKDEWRCHGPFKLLHFDMSESHGEISLEEGLGVDTIVRLLDYLQSDCYRNMFAELAERRQIAVRHAGTPPTSVRARRSGGYVVSLGRGTHVQLAIDDRPNQSSACEFTLVDVAWRTVVP